MVSPIYSLRLSLKSSLRSSLTPTNSVLGEAKKEEDNNNKYSSAFPLSDSSRILYN